MRCEPNELAWSVATSPRFSRKPSLLSKFLTLATILLAILAMACGGGGYGSSNPPPQGGANEVFIVDNFSGDASAFSGASGKLMPVTGGSVMFPPNLIRFAAEPSGMFLAAVSTTPQLVSTLQIANIGTGGTINLAPLTNVVSNPGGMAISSGGILAVTDTINGTVQLTLVQNNALFQGPSAATGPLPQDAVFSGDGSRLYIGNNGDGTVSVFAVSLQGATLQLVQTARLPVAAGEFAPGIVRVTLSASGRKFAATTFDGRLFVGDVSVMDGTLSGISETVVAAGANLEEVVFDPAAKNVYTADQDNGGIFGFTLSTGGSVTPLPGSPFSTGTLPGGPTGMAFNSMGDRLYVVMGAQSAVFTYSRNPSSGKLAQTGDVVSTGGFLAGRIVRVPAH